MHLLSLKTEAIKLRTEGYSYAFISAKLKVAKSTLSLWLNGVTFSPNVFTQQIIAHGQKQVVEIKRVDKMSSIKSAYEFSEEKLKNISDKDFFLLGVGIYIGEGSKSSNYIRVANADPRIIRFMIKWFKVSFNLADSNFKVRIHMYPDSDEKVILDYWKSELKLPLESFHACYIDKRVNKIRKKSKILPYGTAHLSVVSNGDKTLGVLLLRKILASIDRVLGL